MRPDGTRVALVQHRGARSSGGVCFFLPQLALPAKIEFDPALIVIDLRYARWSKRGAELGEWATRVSRHAGVIALYTSGDTDSQRGLRAQGFDDFPMDHGAVATVMTNVVARKVIQPQPLVDWTLERVSQFLDREHEIKEVPAGSEIEGMLANIARFLQDLGDRDSGDLRRARWLLAALAQMPIPLIWYEEAARSLGRLTIRRMISYLGTKNYFDPDLGPVIQTLRMNFNQAYEAIHSNNPRSDALVSVLGQLLNDRSDGGFILVLVRDGVMERAMRTWIEVAGLISPSESERLEIAACSRYVGLADKRFPDAVVNGAFPRRYAWIAGSALAEKVIFLTYRRESDLVVRQLAEVYDREKQLARSSVRQSTVSKLIPSYRSAGAHNSEAVVPELKLVRPDSKPPEETHHKMQTFGTGLKDLGAAMEAAHQQDTDRANRLRLEIEWPDDVIDEETAVSDLGDMASGDDADDVESVRIYVNSRANGAGYVWIPVDQLVECVRLGSSDVLRVFPMDLRVRDVLLWMDDGRRASLFDRIVDLAEDQPQMQYLAAFRQRWRGALGQLAAMYTVGHRVDYGAILASLQQQGALIETELAVRCWVSDAVIGPEKLSSIIAVGRVVGSDHLITHAKEFDRAFRRIRGIRQGIGRRLSFAIRRSFRNRQPVDVAQGDDLDITLGLPVDELVDSIDLAEVVRVDENVRRVPAQLADRFRGSD